MKKRLKLILSFIAIMLMSVFGGIMASSPQTVKAAESTGTLFTGVPEPALYVAYGSETVQVGIYIPIALDSHSEEYESGEYFMVVMRSKTLSKYYNLKNGACELKAEESKSKHSHSNDNPSIIILTDSLLKSGLKDYCDDFYIYSPLDNMPNITVGDNAPNCFLNGTPLFWSVPEDIDKEYYYYAALFKFAHGVPFTGNCVETFTCKEVSGAAAPVSVKEQAYFFLENSTTKNRSSRKAYQELLGIYTGNEAMPVTVKYKSLVDYGVVQECVKTFTMNSLFAQSKDSALQNMYSKLADVSGLSSFNCVYRDFWEIVDGIRHKTEEKIILQAKDYKYEYNKSDSATITVLYEDFKYKDFSIRVTNNDPANHLSVDLYSANVIETTESYTLVFEYSDLNARLLNKCGWLVQLGETDFNGTGVISNKSEKIQVNVASDKLTVTFAKANEAELMNLRICVSAEIVPDRLVNYTVRYNSVLVDGDGNVSEQELNSPVTTCYLSDIDNLNYLDNLMLKHGELINSALEPVGLCGVQYLEPSKCNLIKVDDDNFIITVGYKYHTILRVKVAGVFKHFVALNPYKVRYTLTDLSVVVPSGLRVKNIEVSDGLSANFDDRTVSNSYLTVESDFYSKKILNVDFELTDKWKVNVVFLKNYAYKNSNGQTESSGFAIKDSIEKEVALSEFNSIYTPTEAELEKFLSMESLNVIGEFGAVDMEKTVVERIGEVYYIKLNYCSTSLRMIQSDGQATILNVPLISFAAWADKIDTNWAIDILNMPGKQVFKSQKDVKREDLYGYFYVAVFKEQVKNFDSLFAGYTSSGVSCFFSGKEVVGSDLYKFCDSLGLPGVFFTFGTKLIAQVIGEALHPEYGTYYSYFSFIDGSLPTNEGLFVSNSKADHAFDTDTAFENTVEDTKDDISNWWNSNNELVKGVKVVLGVFGVIAFALVILNVIPLFTNAIGRIKTSNIESTKTPARKKRKH